VPKALRILDFDIENRPLSYWIPDRPTAEITSIAAGFVGHRRVHVDLLGVRCQHGECTDYHLGTSGENMLARFVKLYDQADMVTGHYIRKHDLPIINAMLLEAGMPGLSQKLTCDTKLDMTKKADIPATQEHLSDMMGTRATKYHMKQSMWREANRLTPEGMVLTRKRVVHDVRQHQELRLAMLERGLLHPPKMWRP